MTYGAYTPRDVASYERVRRPRTPLFQAVVCAVTLILSAPAGLWILYGHSVDAPPPVVAPKATLEAKPRPPRYSALIDPAFMSGNAPATFAHSLPISATFETARPAALAMAAPALADGASMDVAPSVAAPSVAAPSVEAPVVVAELPIVPPLPAVPALVRDIPLPRPRPAFLDAADAAPVPVPLDRHVAQKAVAPEAPEHRSFFDRMFHPAQPAGTALAYAAPEDGGLGLFGAARKVSPDHWTAIYDISAHTVTLPDGTRLEAHSGLGAAKDNPNSVTEHMRGATPPNVYELQPREGLFHGVAALRLKPVGGTTYGRGGLLAHTYMLGPRGDSNGCVVFKDYQAFRRAYDNGDIRRLVVVAGGD